MELIIKNGRGNGNTAYVDDNNRLATISVSQAVAEAAAQSGDTFNLNTGLVNLTTANKSAIAYLQNNSGDDLAVQLIGLHLGNSTSGVGDVILDVIKNPTAGTIIDNATEVDIFENKNAASSKTYNIADLPRYKGAEGYTITGGKGWYKSLLPGAARTYAISTGDLILSPGTSMALELTPPAGNTSMNCLAFLAIVNLENVVK